jgi:hypothetical protein
MIKTLAAVLLASAAAAAPSVQRPATPPAVQASTSSAGSAALALGVSTYTVSTLYTGDRVRDPFLPPSMGAGPARPQDKNAPLVVDIHALQLRGIMQDAKADFALFAMDTGAALVLRDGRLFDEHNKRVPGITGRIRIKQKRAELITADKDVQIYSLGEAAEEKNKDKPSEEPKEKGSGRSP